MCDTFVAVGPAAAGGGVLLAKNSDRDPGEPQIVEVVPAADHADGAEVRCTYLTVPQVRHTYRVLLSRPAWMFGCEMGANECGVVVGNEAVFTRERVPATGLLGMDLMRLALERSATADAAMEWIVRLHDEHGQGGSASAFHPRTRYYSSFLIADARGAWVLEFAGGSWAAERVTTGVRSISNLITIEDDWTRASADLPGATNTDTGYDFAAAHTARFMTTMAGSRARCDRTAALAQAKSPLSVGDAMTILRDHGRRDGADGDWHPGMATTKCVCMHATGLLNPSQTTASLVAHTSEAGLDLWLTGSSAPCLSLFKPVELGDPEPLPTAAATGLGFDARSFWWRHETLHRQALRAYPERHRRIREAYDELERRFMVEWPVPAAGIDARAAASHAAFQAGDEALALLLAELPHAERAPRQRAGYRRHWQKWERRALSG